MLLWFPVIVLSYFPFEPQVIEGTTDNWVIEVSDYAQKGVCLVAFVQPRSPPCKAIIEDFNVAANLSKGMIKFLSVDIKLHPKVAHLYTVRAVPAFRIIHPRGISEYSGDTSSDALATAAQKFIVNRALPVDASWAPAPNTPLSAILLTTKKNTPPFWAGISNSFADSKIRIGASHAPQLMSLFGASGPTSIVFVQGEIVSVYDGQLTYESIFIAINEFINNPHASGKAAPIINTIDNIDAFKQFCKNSGKMCVIKSYKSDDNEYMDLAKTNRGGPFRFFICGTKCPLNMKSGVYVFHSKRESAIFVENVDQLSGALDDIVGGGAKFESMKSLFQNEL